MAEAAVVEEVAPMNWEQTDLYRFFAYVFAPPSQQCFTFLARPATADDLRDLCKYLGCGDESP